MKKFRNRDFYQAILDIDIDKGGVFIEEVRNTSFMGRDKCWKNFFKKLPVKGYISDSSKYNFDIDSIRNCEEYFTDYVFSRVGIINVSDDKITCRAVDAYFKLDEESFLTDSQFFILRENEFGQGESSEKIRRIFKRKLRRMDEGRGK